MCDESRKVLVLRPNQDVDVTVKECFSLDKEACIIFQKYDEDWGEFIDVSIQNIQHKDKIQVQVQESLTWTLAKINLVCVLIRYVEYFKFK